MMMARPRIRAAEMIAVAMFLLHGMTLSSKVRSINYCHKFSINIERHRFNSA
jgi:hypothetical protein